MIATAEMITGVALLRNDGRMIALPRPNRHHHLFAIAAFIGADFGDAMQGFIANDAGFYDREGAMQIARRAGQLKRAGLASDELFSEDVW